MKRLLATLLLTLLPALAPAAGLTQPASISASVDDSHPYVQAEVVLTLRISYDADQTLLDASISDLQVNGARVQQVGPPHQRMEEVKGRQRRLIIMRFAIFPEHSGTLRIPSLRFNASQLDNDETPLFAFGRPGKRLQLRSPGITLQVRPKPASYPKNAPWLPARSRTLSELWRPEPKGLKVGDSVTRTLRVRAQGLTSPQLPSLPAIHSSQVRDYSDQPTLLTQVDRDGLTGVRDESHALVPTRKGELKLPDIDLVWWNTQKDRLEHARLPGRTLQIAPGPAQAEPEPLPDQTSATDGLAPRLWPWQLATLVLALTTALGFYLYWRQGSTRRRRQPANAPHGRQQLLSNLQGACASNDPKAARQALDRWAHRQPQTLAVLAAGDPPLAQALDELNQHLYGSAPQGWNGLALWQAVSQLADGKAQPTDRSTLPPLYPP